MDHLSTLAGWLASALNTLATELDRARALVRDAMERLVSMFASLRGQLAEERRLYEAAIGAVVGTSFHDGIVQVLRTVLGRFIDDTLKISQSSVRILMEIETLRGHAEFVAAHGERIETIAQNTRTIALNARIEAHRAGAAGAVFRVVADEIRVLAKESSELSLMIREAIEQQATSLGEASRAANQVVCGDLDFITASHKELDVTIERLSSVSRTSTSALARIQVTIDSAIQALQFEDMLEQLLGGVSSKLSAIQRMCAELATSGDYSRLALDLQELDATVARVAVTQQSVASGTVELF